ncbi:hypothetical protein ACIHDR_23020 [Nocardia sp. NPDC052278]|uniref:hypothetical protein n=1 Tax=unclassified Nocardia TaxID=2637762 RepID=UPI00367C9EE1
MREIQPKKNEIAPSVKALLAAFNEDTPEKLELAPSHSHPTLQRSDGSWCEVDEDGWPAYCEDMDQDDESASSHSTELGLD